jgi:hypothetical protein
VRAPMLAVCFIMFSGLAQADSLYVRLVGLHPSDSGSFKDVAVRAGYAYVTGGGGGLHVLLLADPVHLQSLMPTRRILSWWANALRGMETSEWQSRDNMHT